MSNSFVGLEPNSILDFCQELGLVPDGYVLQLNSYENRVFQVNLEGSLTKERLPELYRAAPNQVIVKVYRPERWSKDALLEEHLFLDELFKEQLNVVAPFNFFGQTLFNRQGFYFAVFPKAYGRLPDEVLRDDYAALGRVLAQIHLVGQRRKAKNRPEFFAQKMIASIKNNLSPFVAPEVRDRYWDAAEQILDRLEDGLNLNSYLRIHGDFHRGNLLKTDTSANAQFLIMDFDDHLNGPEVYDFWMIASQGEKEDFDRFIDGYLELREFPEDQLELIPFLRGWRILSYAHWIAQRWSDPTFPRLFPQFKDYTYWAEETESLEKIARLT
jgi:Ser/Thr protein kinase RdoA (MazF antagonist)